jgi:hypothetical protein
MECPKCLGHTEPLSGSTQLLTWYVCASCGHFWSARIRDGSPVAEIPVSIGTMTAQ